MGFTKITDNAGQDDTLAYLTKGCETVIYFMHMPLHGSDKTGICHPDYFECVKQQTLNHNVDIVV